MEITGKAHALLELLSESADTETEVEAVIDEHFDELVAGDVDQAGVRAAGRRRGPRHYRRRRPPVLGPPAPRPAPPNALTEAERQHILTVLRSRGVLRPGPGPGVGPAARRRRLPVLDLHDVPAAGHRRARTGNGAASAPTRPSKKPELIARRPEPGVDLGHHQAPGPERGVYYELFVIIDIYSRYVVGWMVAPAETGELAEAFIADTLARQGIEARPADPARRPGHVDDLQAGRPAAGRPRRRPQPHPPARVATTTPTRRRNFKTLKYCPAFPGRFGSIEDARAFCAAFFEHYNHVHRHAGIGLHTPASVHYGTATEIRAERAETLDAAYAANPARFRHRHPRQGGGRRPHRRCGRRRPGSGTRCPGSS